MKQQTVQFNGIEQAALIDSDVPSVPLGPSEVFGHTVYSLVSPGTELAGYRGQYSSGRFPVTPGYAAVFQVDEIGAEVIDLKPGDFAFSMGNHRSVQRALRENVLALPNNLSPAVAPFARLMGVTMTTLTTTQARPPARVIVTGLGLVGHLAAKMFHACGYQVLAVDPIAERRAAIAQTQGIETAAGIPLTDPAYAGKVALVVECSGHEQAAMDACKVVQKRGEVVIVAAMWQQRTTLSALELLNTIFNRYVEVRSGWE
ncbi:MAG TPA: zinc-binding dehydrogenase, partial [Anaerolineae bacterium]